MNCDEQDEVDARLRDAFYGPLPDSARIEALVRRRIAVETSRRWIGMCAGLAAAAIFAVVFGYRHQTPQIFAEAARDHQAEVSKHMPRRWRTSEADIAALTQRYNVPQATLAAFAPVGYRLEQAKTCGLEGRPVLHLVYTNGAQEFSLYIRKRGGSSLPVGAVAVGPEHIAAVQTGAFDTVIVTDGSSADCLKLAGQIKSTI